MNYYTLNRIEDRDIAVLIDDNGKKRDVPIKDLPPQRDIGCVYSICGDSIVYDETETIKRRTRIGEKKNRLFAKWKLPDNSEKK